MVTVDPQRAQGLTTMGHIAQFGCFARTSDRPRHKGITCFILDMSSPGVEVRPLRQMTGDAEFNEVFFTDVVIPDQCRIGEVDDGWRIAIGTLMEERNVSTTCKTPMCRPSSTRSHCGIRCRPTHARAPRSPRRPCRADHRTRTCGTRCGETEDGHAGAGGIVGEAAGRRAQPGGV